MAYYYWRSILVIHNSAYSGLVFFGAWITAIGHKGYVLQYRVLFIDLPFLAWITLGKQDSGAGKFLEIPSLLPIQTPNMQRLNIGRIKGAYIDFQNR